MQPVHSATFQYHTILVQTTNVHKQAPTDHTTHILSNNTSTATDRTPFMRLLALPIYTQFHAGCIRSWLHLYNTVVASTIGAYRHDHTNHATHILRNTTSPATNHAHWMQLVNHLNQYTSHPQLPQYLPLPHIPNKTQTTPHSTQHPSITQRNALPVQ